MLIGPIAEVRLCKAEQEGATYAAQVGLPNSASRPIPEIVRRVVQSQECARKPADAAFRPMEFLPFSCTFKSNSTVPLSGS